MNNDLISREALKAEVRKHAEYYADRTSEDRANAGYIECACEILDFIDNAPTVDAVVNTIEVRPQGEYIRKEDVIALLNKWADGYSYIEIPTEDAIKAIMEFNPKGDTE